MNFKIKIALLRIWRPCRISCECSQQQPTNNTVDTCPLTKFEVGLQSLRETGRPRCTQLATRHSRAEIHLRRLWRWIFMFSPVCAEPLNWSTTEKCR